MNQDAQIGDLLHLTLHLQLFIKSIFLFSFSFCLYMYVYTMQQFKEWINLL